MSGEHQTARSPNLWRMQKVSNSIKTIDSSPDTVTVSALIYGLCGIVIGHYSITVPRSEAERLSITFPITLQPAETESDGKQS